MTNVNAPVQVASVQTLQRRQLPEADVVIVDEAHRAHKVIFDWMDQCPKTLFIGLSATPWTRGLGKHYTDLIVAATTQELIDAGYLSPFQVFAPSHPDLSNVKTVAGDYHEGQLSEVMSKSPLIADIVSTWLRIGENRPTLCFAVDRPHARKLQDQFMRAGVMAEYADADTPANERTAMGKRLAAGETQVVCNVGIFTTGTDWPFVSCLILARPTKSEMLYTQIIGRGLRPNPGKADCTILDHSDTTLRLGFVTDIHHDKLDDGKRAPVTRQAREKREKLPTDCPSCARVKPAGVHKCPSCGFAPERQSTVETLAGELVQINGKKPVYDHATKQRWYSMLLWECQERGYKSGWLANQYRDKFGVWPKNLLPEPRYPEADVSRWLQSRRIAFAKGRAKAAEANSHAA